MTHAVSCFVKYNNNMFPECSHDKTTCAEIGFTDVNSKGRVSLSMFIAFHWYIKSDTSVIVFMLHGKVGCTTDVNI